MFLLDFSLTGKYWLFFNQATVKHESRAAASVKLCEQGHVVRTTEREMKVQRGGGGGVKQHARRRRKWWSMQSWMRASPWSAGGWVFLLCFSESEKFPCPDRSALKREREWINLLFDWLVGWLVVQFSRKLWRWSREERRKNNNISWNLWTTVHMINKSAMMDQQESDQGRKPSTPTHKQLL